jgi:hypothetical protein
MVCIFTLSTVIQCAIQSYWYCGERKLGFLGFNRPFPLYNQNFDLGKSRQIFHHSLKEHHKISNIPKFRCEML